MDESQYESTKIWSSIQIYVHIEYIYFFPNITACHAVYFLCFSSVTNSIYLIISRSKLFEPRCMKSCIKTSFLEQYVFQQYMCVCVVREDNLQSALILKLSVSYVKS